MAALKDYCIAAFKQADPIGKLFPEGHQCRRGVCFGLSVDWIARRLTHSGEDAQKRIDALGTDDAVIHASIKQRLYSAELFFEMDRSLAQENSHNEVLALEGLKVVSSESKRVDTGNVVSLQNTLDMLEANTSAARAFNLIFMAFDSKAAHFVATYTEGGLIPDLFMFDPNFGEHKIRRRDSQDLMKALIDTYKNDYKQVVNAFVVQRVGVA